METAHVGVSRAFYYGKQRNGGDNGTKLAALPGAKTGLEMPAVGALFALLLMDTNMDQWLWLERVQALDDVEHGRAGGGVLCQDPPSLAQSRARMSH